MPDQTLKCPKCGTQIELTGVLTLMVQNNRKEGNKQRKSVKIRLHYITADKSVIKRKNTEHRIQNSVSISEISD